MDGVQQALGACSLNTHLQTFSPAFLESQILAPPANLGVQGPGQVAQLWPKGDKEKAAESVFKVF